MKTNEMHKILLLKIEDQLTRRSKFEDEEARVMCLDRIMGMLLYAKSIDVITAQEYEEFYTKYVENVEFLNLESMKIFV